MIQVAVMMEDRAVLASGTVRNRIRMCGSVEEVDRVEADARLGEYEEG
jgi:hypothetical protein